MNLCIRLKSRNNNKDEVSCQKVPFLTQKKKAVHTFCHRGERNSLTARPISPYDIGESQNPHFSQLGIEAAIMTSFNYFSSTHEEEMKPMQNILRFGITKPLNTNIISIDKIPAVEATTIVRKRDAKKRNMDIDVKWRANNINKWRKNLKKSKRYIMSTSSSEDFSSWLKVHRPEMWYFYLPASGLYPIT